MSRYGEPTTLSVLSSIDHRLAVMEGKLNMLNDWHNKVNGGLATLVFLSGGGILVTLLSALLPRILGG